MDKKKKRANSLKDKVLLSIVVFCIALIVIYQGQTVITEIMPKATETQHIEPFLDYEPEFIEEQ